MALVCDTCLAQGFHATGEEVPAARLVLCAYHKREFEACIAGVQLMFRYGGPDKIPTREPGHILMISTNINAKELR